MLDLNLELFTSSDLWCRTRYIISVLVCPKSYISAWMFCWWQTIVCFTVIYSWLVHKLTLQNNQFETRVVDFVSLIIRKIAIWMAKICQLPKMIFFRGKKTVFAFFFRKQWRLWQFFDIQMSIFLMIRYQFVSCVSLCCWGRSAGCQFSIRIKHHSGTV